MIWPFDSTRMLRSWHAKMGNTLLGSTIGTIWGAGSKAGH